MKANEFVKKFGWGDARGVIKNADTFATHIKFYGGDTLLIDYIQWDGMRISVKQNDEWIKLSRLYQEVPELIPINDLKRLVESHGLVERVGGLDRVKKALDGKHIGYTHFYLHSNDRYVFLDHYVDFIPDHAQHIGMFNKAIKDVEACKEVL